MLMGVRRGPGVRGGVALIQGPIRERENAGHPLSYLS